MDVLWVIISYNNSHLTTQSVEAILNQSVPCRVVVWDNKSPDGSGDVLRERFQNTENVTIVESETNLLWTPAINAAISQFWNGERYIGISNNDLTIPKFATERFISTVSQPEVGIVAPTGSGLGGPQDFATHHGIYKPFRARHLGTKRVTYVVGACFFLRKDVYDHVGPLDEEMPLGADDHDYCIRLKKEGYQIWIDEGVYAQHECHATGADGNWNVWGQKSWDRFHEKWKGYYTDEEEAFKCHWGGVYHEGFDK